MGVQDHFQYVRIFVRIFVGIFVGFFADGVLDHFPICGMRIHLHALVVDIGHTIAAGIPALSDAIDVCASKHQSALIGGDGDSSSSR